MSICLYLGTYVGMYVYTYPYVYVSNPQNTKMVITRPPDRLQSSFLDQISRHDVAQVSESFPRAQEAQKICKQPFFPKIFPTWNCQNTKMVITRPPDGLQSSFLDQISRNNVAQVSENFPGGH